MKACESNRVWKYEVVWNRVQRAEFGIEVGARTKFEG